MEELNNKSETIDEKLRSLDEKKCKIEMLEKELLKKINDYD